jgi:transcriptional regulator GlxA family with amidase domain
MPSPVNPKPVPRDVAQAIAYMRVNLHRNIPVAELAATVGVGERTLRQHFRSFMGVSPGDYGIRLRLAAARRDLQLSGRTSSVTRIATKYAFSHLGRFSGLYRQAFGEAPSTTRRQVLPV